MRTPAPSAASQTATIRRQFDKVRDAAVAKGDLDAAARIELAREFFTNPAFAKALADHVWQQTGGEG